MRTRLEKSHHLNCVLDNANKEEAGERLSGVKCVTWRKGKHSLSDACCWVRNPNTEERSNEEWSKLHLALFVQLNSA